MKHVLSTVALLAFAVGLDGISHAEPAGQASAYQPPRLSSGKPDLQGVWTNASLTKLERPAKVKDLVVPPDQLDQVMSNYNWKELIAQDAKPSDPNAGVFKDGDTAAGYNAFWIDPGTQVAKVKGEYRSSWIVDPPNGKVPYTAFARGELMKAFGQMRSFDGPEVRPASERCITGFGSTGGPPMLNVLYNNHYQIVQGRDDVMILVEMNHDARIIRMGGQHRPAHMKQWLGDTVGRWEGDTLVAETTNFHPGDSIRADMDGFLFMSPDTKVTERFTRVADDEIFYEFLVEDSKFYTQPWKGEMSLRRRDEPIYEYACHEGNYALPGILSGARKEEADKAAAAQAAAKAPPAKSGK